MVPPRLARSFYQPRRIRRWICKRKRPERTSSPRASSSPSPSKAISRASIPWSVHKIGATCRSRTIFRAHRTTSTRYRSQFHPNPPRMSSRTLRTTSFALEPLPPACTPRRPMSSHSPRNTSPPR